jgi:hypothetical protein
MLIKLQLDVIRIISAILLFNTGCNGQQSANKNRVSK